MKLMIWPPTHPQEVQDLSVPLVVLRGEHRLLVEAAGMLRGRLPQREPSELLQVQHGRWAALCLSDTDTQSELD